MTNRDSIFNEIEKDYYIEGYGYIPTDASIKDAMDLYGKQWEDKYKEANQFICDLGKLIGLDGLGYDDIKASIEDFRDAIDEKKKEFCLELLEYMAKNTIECEMWIPGARFHFNDEWITAEQLFEIFL